MDDTKKTKEQLITELEELRQRFSRDEYNAIINTTSDGYWEIGEKGKFINVNNKYCEMSGYSRKELLGMRINDVDVMESPEETKAQIEKVIKDGFDRFETKHRRKNGSIYDVEISAMFMKDIKKYVVFINDITDRKKSEEAILISKKLLSETQTIAKVGSWEWNIKTGESFVSEQLYNILGRDIKLGIPSLESYWESSHPDDRDRVRKTIETAIKENKPYKIEYRFYRESDGEERWLRSECIFEEDANGHPNRLLGFAQDITESKKAEEALRVSEQRFKGAFDYAAIGLALVSPEGRFIKVNKSLCELLGYDKKELLSLTFQEITHPDD